MGIEFEQDTTYKTPVRLAPAEAGVAGWLMKKGVVKTKNGANILLICIALLSLGLAIGIPSIVSPTKNGAVVYKEDIPQEIRSKMSPEYLSRYPSRNQ